MADAMVAEKAAEKKNIYVVLGMARSGTSAIARGLKALGIELGENLTQANSLWNPKGFWEDTEIVYKINRGVLFALNYTWMSVNLIDNLCEQTNLEDLKKLAIHLLKQRMASTCHWGFKDPRTAKILPFWQDVFKTIELNEHYIIALRNPLATAHSYQRVSGVDIEVGLLLWLMHLIPAIDGSLGKKRLMVSYDLMLQDPRYQLQRIKTYFNIPTLVADSEINAYTEHFLDKNLNHYEHTDADLKKHSAMTIAPVICKMYALFMQLAKDEITFDSKEFTYEWQKLKNEFNEVYPIYCYLDATLKKNKKLEKQIKTLKKSMPWKLVYPLRIIDDLLRNWRRKLRTKRRLINSYE